MKGGEAHWKGDCQQSGKSDTHVRFTDGLPAVERRFDLCRFRHPSGPLACRSLCFT
jgi:hypothetical protein